MSEVCSWLVVPKLDSIVINKVNIQCNSFCNTSQRLVAAIVPCVHCVTDKIQRNDARHRNCRMNLTRHGHDGSINFLHPIQPTPINYTNPIHNILYTRIQPNPCPYIRSPEHIVRHSVPISSTNTSNCFNFTTYTWTWASIHRTQSPSQQFNRLHLGCSQPTDANPTQPTTSVGGLA